MLQQLETTATAENTSPAAPENSQAYLTTLSNNNCSNNKPEHLLLQQRIQRQLLNLLDGDRKQSNSAITKKKMEHLF